MHSNKEIDANLVKLKANRGVGGIIGWQGRSRAEAGREIHVDASSP